MLGIAGRFEYRGEKAFRAWLFAVAANAARDHRRRLGSRERLAESAWLVPLAAAARADVDRCFGPDRIQLSSRLAGVGVLTWKRGGGPALTSVTDIAERRDLLEVLEDRHARRGLW